MIFICLQYEVVLKIQKWTAEVFKLNDLKHNYITYAKQSILSDQNYGIAVFFFLVKNSCYFVERNFEGKKFESKIIIII
jgi:hypothetical protein